MQFRCSAGYFHVACHPPARPLHPLCTLQSPHDVPGAQPIYIATIKTVYCLSCLPMVVLDSSKHALPLPNAGRRLRLSVVMFDRTGIRGSTDANFHANLKKQKWDGQFIANVEVA